MRWRKNFCVFLMVAAEASRVRAAFELATSAESPAKAFVKRLFFKRPRESPYQLGPPARHL